MQGIGRAGTKKRKEKERRGESIKQRKFLFLTAHLKI